MSGFLEQVVAAKAQEIAAKRQRRPEALLQRAAADERVRDFRLAVSGGGRVIAEIKRRSPSVAVFRQQGPVELLARQYANNGAAAISIVTDTPNFGTSLADVEIVRRAVDLPVLVKDFVIDRYQLLEARAAGADCILLIARILEPEQLAELHAEATAMGMAVLVECHDEQDIERALAADATLVGVNSRDLSTLSVSLDTTRRLLAGIPGGVIRVAESGIAGREDVERLAAMGADVFLIGTALLQSEDPGGTLRTLLGAETKTVDPSSGEEPVR